MVDGFLGVVEDKIEVLFVRRRGAGTGTKLLNFALRESGARKVDVNEQNHKARSFYEKHGFEFCGRSETGNYGRNYPLLNMEF